jgi:hypothetical protein
MDLEQAMRVYVGMPCTELEGSCQKTGQGRHDNLFPHSSQKVPLAETTPAYC